MGLNDGKLYIIDILTELSHSCWATNAPVTHWVGSHLFLFSIECTESSASIGSMWGINNTDISAQVCQPGMGFCLQTSLRKESPQNHQLMEDDKETVLYI